MSFQFVNSSTLPPTFHSRICQRTSHQRQPLVWPLGLCCMQWKLDHRSRGGSTGSVRESAKVQVFTSPLFPDRTFTSRHVVYLDIDFPSMGFSILQIMCRIMEDSDIQAQAPIIFGQDLISMYGILNYIIKPDKYCAVQPPAQAPEEFLDNDEHCVLPFPAASSASPRHRGTATSRNRCYH